MKRIGKICPIVKYFKVAGNLNAESYNSNHQNQAPKKLDLTTSAGRQMSLRETVTGLGFCPTPASGIVF